MDLRSASSSKMRHSSSARGMVVRLQWTKGMNDSGSVKLDFLIIYRVSSVPYEVD